MAALKSLVKEDEEPSENSQMSRFGVSLAPLVEVWFEKQRGRDAAGYLGSPAAAVAATLREAADGSIFGELGFFYALSSACRRSRSNELEFKPLGNLDP
ncbi:hypothetical protein V6N12_018952 [Hibiscus sabdariffa]|uniref:Uncharacterized protein n=1 Tax=Hibiscus sabdariffa TaxID=183260 RepID=A0ABR2AZ37_9ROSI